MTVVAVGDRVLLRYAPYGSSGVVTALVNGKAQVRWGDLELTAKHAPESLLLSEADTVIANTATENAAAIEPDNE